MGELLDLIFSNFLIVAAIIGGIISWFSGMTKDEEKRKRPMGSPRPDPSPEPQRSSPTSMSPSNNESREMKSGKDRLKEYYEEKQRRLDEVSDHRKNQADAQHTFTYETPKKDVHTLMSRDINSEKQNKEFYAEGWSQSQKWDKKRLAEGIIMAEILGPPRAHKPHRSHPRKR
ncbi:hypothetical protein [Halobacillus mangrovi]|uniref:Uncharacterized protein n=1 Tax=Halobacillus mangrovi TaxID=402384 RepID=A0A1W5ZUS8_9BACI|nr:hypothetical protein [Halobacillus mangrovi]ARI77021.1 hypothetical protein HM131_09280 [Halobacillus mangrovi]